jgi:hypothetical protein
VQLTEASAGHAGEEEPLKARGQPPWYWARGVRAWIAGTAKLLALIVGRRKREVIILKCLVVGMGR